MTRQNTSNVALNGPLALSVVAIAVALIVVLSGFAMVLTSALGGGTHDAEPVQEMEQLAAKHNESMQTWQERFNGRSSFFRPPSPPQTPEMPDEVKDEEVTFEQPDEPPIDPPYPGPPVAFAYADTVYFHPLSATARNEYLRIQVGEEVAGLRVVSISLPWTVKVKFRGRAYDVPVFIHPEDSLLLTDARSGGRA